jgi:hypothetical protein
MPPQSVNLETRIKALNAVLTEKEHQDAVDQEMRAVEGDWSAALGSLKHKLPGASLEKVALAHSVAAWSDDNVPVVKAIDEDPEVNSLRDVALRFDVEKLAAIVDPEDVPEAVTGATAEEKAKNFAVALQRRLFATERTAVLQRMVHEAEVPIADATVRSGVTRFLGNLPDFDIRTTSVYTALQHADAFKDIANEHRPLVVAELKTLQRVQALTPVPEAIPALMKANLTSAFHVAEMPQSTFLEAHGKTLGEETARQVYTNAINARIRNEHALMTMRDAVRGTGLAIIDGKESPQERMARLQDVANAQQVPINLDTLFGGMDYCECEDCTSVYSPAAYFVDLLQYLRNNNLGPNPAEPSAPNPNIHPGIKDTPLEKLFRRRPDLGCLELTCENTNTVLPYIDLVNEVMESFVVHLGEYKEDPNDPKQATLEAFNVEGEASSELLAQPQHVNYEAYCILKNAVYPFTLPYHQPIDAARIFLNYLGTSRHELLDTFRKASETCETVTLTPAEQQELQKLHVQTLDRAVDAEFLGITQEEYIILTKEAFWPKRYFELTQKAIYADDQYQQKIGVRPIHEYYGYQTEAEMLSTDEAKQKGLTFVKKQFLPRTGIQYADLVELLKTQCINPNLPKGKALTLLESIRFSYRFLQTLADTSSNDPKVKYAKLIAFLEMAQPFIPLLDAMLHPDPCHQHRTNWCLKSKDLRNWVYCYFERIGKLIVLESGEGQQLPIWGSIYTPEETPRFVGTLRKDGTIVNTEGAKIGYVTVTIGKKLADSNTIVDQSGNRIGYVSSDTNISDNIPVPVAWPIIWTDGKSFTDRFGSDWLKIKDPRGDGYDTISERHGLNGRYEDVLIWLPARDTCDLSKVRLTHLDGTALAPDEYDRLQRFIRLWRKMGWTVDDTDKALIGLSASPGGGTPGTIGECEYVGFEAFVDDCSCGGEDDDGTGQDEWDCPKLVEASCAITPDFLHQLVAVRRLLDLTGLPLAKLLTFWTDISTAGEPSLYARLFLTHNLLGIDDVFKADAHGNYLTQSAKITDHLNVLMAALNLKADDVSEIMSLRQLPDSLTLSNVSALYRHSLLARTLHVRVTNLRDVITLFGDPFKSAYATLTLFERWGKMEDAGFSFRQLDYLIRDHDDPLRPLAPSQRTILQITKTLYDGLNAIDGDHPDLKPEDKDAATTGLVRAKAGLLFEQMVVDRIVGLLEGTTVYSTNAPANLSITIPDALANKLKYTNQKDATPPTASIQVTGILTDGEANQAKALSSLPEWPKAIDRVGKQARNFFNDVLFGIFPNKDEASRNLLAGDVNVPPDPQNPNATDANTAPAKRLYFLRFFMAFLRERLAQRLIVDTMSGFAGLANDMTKLLLSDVLKAGTPPQSALGVLEQIHKAQAEGSGGWQGYLIPSADEDFVFVAIGDKQPAALIIDGQSVPFTVQQEDPSNVWSTDPTKPVRLKSGKLYRLVVSDRPADQLQWKTSTSPKAKIPASALLPDYSSQGAEDAFTKLHKAALLVNGFNLSTDEVAFWQTRSADFDGFDFNAVTLQHWLRLEGYTRLRNGLPRTGTSLLDLFSWASKPDDATKLSERIAAATLWKKENIEKLIAARHFDLNRPEFFTNEVKLVALAKAMGLVDKIAVNVDLLFEWARPLSGFWVCHKIAESIRKAIRARYNQDDWEQVVKPLNDQLREHQKRALISYLLVQQDLIDWGVLDADSLFEFFLIDVQMDACMETSRIKQAISSVQLFVQRCLLGLEEEHGVAKDALDRDRWQWMQRYRVWEANRKVFLYPENWIQPQLRDDKSPFYRELESDLLQKDLDTQAIEDLLKTYLFKVDDIANLRVVGLFLEKKEIQGTQVPVKLHIFGRARSAPYPLYYRYFDISEANWYAWDRVQIDTPNYDVEDGNKRILENGTYVIPLVWNNRLLIFVPQIAKKTRAQTLGDKVEGSTGTVNGNISFDIKKPIDEWEIKLGWSEYRNGKWTQKQLSADALYDDQPKEVRYYEFIPGTVDKNAVVINVWQDTKDLGTFSFTGSQVIGKAPPQPPGPSLTSSTNQVTTDFHFDKATPPVLHSLQDDATLINQAPYFKDEQESPTITRITPDLSSTEVAFLHPFVRDLLGQLNVGGLSAVIKYFATLSQQDLSAAFGADTEAIYNELKAAYSLYNWEIAFHAPMHVADRLLTAQQFERALSICQYVFNPLRKGPDIASVWQFPPFREIVKPENSLQGLFFDLKAGQPDARINEWRSKPFQPHIVARGRPVSYAKWVVSKYIEILIAWGDYLFRQDTIESINQATQLYILAAHLYGPAGQRIPRRGRIVPQTYMSLLDKWDAFSNAMVELELVFPFSSQTPLPIGVSDAVVGLANVFGFATTLYFCIPDNPQLRALRQTIDDRLFKIRHCETIAGVFRILPLFEPPIDPALLVQAAAQGLSISTVLNDLNSPMPNYRFTYLLQKALELCTELKSLGGALLSTKEKLDGEALAQLRATHESSINNLVMEVRKQQLDEADKSIEALQQSRMGPAYRLRHYMSLIGEDTSKVPDGSTDFSELQNQIEPPIDDSGLKLIPYEKEEMDKASDAADWQTGIGAVETLASVFHALPSTHADGHPMGVGVDIVWGFPNLANATSAVARGLRIHSDRLSYESSRATIKGGFLRQLQDRVQQGNIAGYEIKNIDKQITAQTIRRNIAQQEITNQQRQIDNAREVEDFLRNKYTNKELYSWMDGQIRSLYHQSYTLAYELGKKAEKAFRFERGLSSSNFIQYGYWDPAYDGLLSGERLYVGLKQLEAAYQESRGYDYEVSKHVSLRQINPMALLRLRETGTCEFSLPEVLFDMDYPGHYMRRIKSVALTIPSVVGPYTSLNCTLRILQHKFRTSAIAKDKNDYQERLDEADDRFSTVNIPITSIAVSTSQNESGVFELNFRDERYIPFEGAGVMSRWRVQLPETFRQFDYDTISDVVMHLRYTAVEGGDKLKKAAADFVQDYIKSVEQLSREEGLFAAFDLKHDFPSEWYKAMQPPSGAIERLLTLTNLYERLPIFTKGRPPAKIQATDVYLFTSAALSASALILAQATDEFTFTDGPPLGTMKCFVIKDISCPMSSWQLKIQDTKLEVQKLWLVARYVLQ